jgi:hypothetical protein
MIKHKISCKEKFLPYSVLEQIVKESTIPKIPLEEDQSELIMETLHGKGRVVFKNNNIYEGELKYGILDCPDAKITFDKEGIIYQGQIQNNQINGRGTYTFTKTNAK